MIKNLNNLVLHSLQRLYFPVVPTVVCLKDRYQSFSFFRSFISKTYCLCLLVVLSVKEKNYINFKSFTYKKLNCLTVFPCKTTYSIQFLKNCLRCTILFITFQLKTFKNLPTISTSLRLSQFIYHHKGGSFLGFPNKSE